MDSYSGFFQLKMVIFHSYVKLPEGIPPSPLLSVVEVSSGIIYQSIPNQTPPAHREKAAAVQLGS